MIAAANVYNEGAIDAPQCHSRQQQRVRQITQLHAIAKLSHKEFSAIVEANEPLIVLLEYTLACNTMLTKDSIDARLGSVRLPTTVKQTHIVLTNVCDVVAVEIHFRLVSVSIKLYTSVCFGPVEVVADGSIHLTFDLAGHVKEKNWFEVWRERSGLIPLHMNYNTGSGVNCKAVCATLLTVTQGRWKDRRSLQYGDR